MVAVPALTPVTLPVLATLAIVPDELLHVPPEVASVSVARFPVQTFTGPEIDAG